MGFLQTGGDVYDDRGAAEPPNSLVHQFAHHHRYPAFIVTFDVPVPAAADDDDDDGATAASAAESVGARGDGGQPAAKRARVSSGAASSSAGGAVSAAAAAASAPAASAATGTRLSRTAPPATLLGGYRVGDEVFYTGSSQTTSTGDRLVYGGKGEVVGPATNETVKGKGLTVQFPGNPGPVDCFLTTLSRTAP